MNTIKLDLQGIDPSSEKYETLSTAYLRKRNKKQGALSVKNLKTQIKDILSPSHSRKGSTYSRANAEEPIETEENLLPGLEYEDFEYQIPTEKSEDDEIGNKIEDDKKRQQQFYRLQTEGDEQQELHFTKESDHASLKKTVEDRKDTEGALETSIGDGQEEDKYEGPNKERRKTDQFQDKVYRRGSYDLKNEKGKSMTVAEKSLKESSDDLSQASKFSSMRSKHWKKAKITMNAVSFQSGANDLVEQKVTNIMQGETPVDISKLGKRRMYISPESKKTYVWEIIISLTIIYYAFGVPYRCGQNVNAHNWIPFDVTMDAIILLDIILTFFTGYKQIDKMIKSKKLIAQKYLKRKFWFDLIAVLPLQYAQNELYIFKFLRVVHLGRLGKMARIGLFKISTNKWYNYFKYLKFFFIFFFSLNALSSIWVALGNFAIQDDQSWIKELEIEASSFLVKYLNAVFFIITTASTVGFGDINPVTDSERLICMAIEFLGIIIIAFYQGQITYFLNNASIFSARTSNVDIELEKWLFEKERAKSLFASQQGQHRGDLGLAETIGEIHSYFKFFRSHDLQYGTGCEFLDKMDPNVQNEVIFNSFQDIIRKFGLFLMGGEEIGFAREVLSRLKPRAFFPKEKIIKRGTRPTGIYFILRGTVVIKNSHNEAIAEINERSYFGDCILIDKNAVFHYVAGGCIVKCLFIKDQEFLDIAYRYGNSYNFLKGLSLSRNDHFLKLSRKNCEEKIKLYEDLIEEMKEKQQQEKEQFEKTETMKFSKGYIKSDNDQQEHEEPEPEEFNVVSVQDVTIPEMNRGGTTPTKNIESCNYASTPGFSYDKGSIRIFETEKASKLFGTAFQKARSSLGIKAGSQDLSDKENSPQKITDPKMLRYMYTIDEAPDPKEREELFNKLFKNKGAHELDDDEGIEQGDQKNRKSVSPTKIEDLDEEGYLRQLIDKLKKDEDDDHETEVNSGDYDDEALHGNDEMGYDDEDDDGQAEELNDSLEVPIDHVEPDFDDKIDTEYILSYFDSRIDTINNKMEKIQKQLRLGCMDGVKTIKKVGRILKNNENESVAPSEVNTPKGAQTATNPTTKTFSKFLQLKQKTDE